MNSHHKMPYNISHLSLKAYIVGQIHKSYSLLTNLSQIKSKIRSAKFK